MKGGGGDTTNTIFTIQVALQLNVDTFTIVVSKSCSEKSCQHDMEGKETLEGSIFSKIEQLTE